MEYITTTTCLSQTLAVGSIGSLYWICRVYCVVTSHIIQCNTTFVMMMCIDDLLHWLYSLLSIGLCSFVIKWLCILYF